MLGTEYPGLGTKKRWFPVAPVQYLLGLDRILGNPRPPQWHLTPGFRHLNCSLIFPDYLGPTEI